MPYGLEALHSKLGLSLATHVWGTTVSSVALIAAPSSGRQLELRYIVVAASAAGSVRITSGTGAATTHWIFTGSAPFAEYALVELPDGEGATLHATQGVGNGFIRVYFATKVNTGSGLVQ